MFRTVKRIIDWCGDFRKRLYTGFVFSFFSYWFAAAPVMVAAYTTGKLIMSTRGEESFNPDLIWMSAVIIGVFIFLRFLFDYFRARYQETISYELVARDRLKIGDALKRVSLGYFSSADTGNILSSVTTGLTTLENMGIRMLDTFIGGYLNYLAIFICLLFISPLSALISLAAAALSFVFLLSVSKHSKASAPLVSENSRELTGAAIEFIRGLPVIKSFGDKGGAVRALEDAAEKSRDIHTKTEWGFVPSNSLHVFALKCGSAGIAMGACLAYMGDNLSFPLMLMMVFFSFTIFGSIEPISDSAHVLGVIDDAMDKLDALKQNNFIDEDGRDIKPDNFNIAFENVSFGYDERQVIKNVSFDLKEKTSTAIVGPSGSGKTTLISLLARFYDVNEGRITVGGHDLREFTCDSLLSNISMVFQNVYLFHDTVRANICFGRDNVSEQDMINAAKKACCHDFIMKLPDGYDTVIGEGGGTLSGGEKQRISIARAMLKDAPVVILDEATASIDPENEHLIQNALSELTRNKTVITIAHRLATIEKADKILVIDDGRLTEEGTHEELIKKEGLYRRFTEARARAEGWNI